LSLTTEATVNVPLYPRFIVPAVLVELVTFLITIWSLTFRLCGLSVKTVILAGGPALYVQVVMNLGFLLKS